MHACFCLFFTRQLHRFDRAKNAYDALGKAGAALLLQDGCVAVAGWQWHRWIRFKILRRLVQKSRKSELY
jgi:hypothetical protein